MNAILGSGAAKPGTLITPVPRPGVRVPAHERVVLDNGLTLIILPRHDVPLVSFNAVLRGGESAGPAERPGIASLVAGLLEKGAGERDAFEFVDAVEGAGGTFGAGAGPESISVRGTFLARDQHLMLELLADALLRPHFAPEELEILCTRHIELIKAAKDSDPSELLGTYGRARLFRGHPYARPVFGSERSLAAATHGDILDYYGSHFGANNLVLIVAGDVDAAWLRRAVEKCFARWPQARVVPATLSEPQRWSRRDVLLVDAPGSTQSHFWIGNLGVSRHYPQRAALDLVNTLYGGRFTSVLNTELRVKSGLSYGARSGFTRGSVAGEFAIRSFAQTADTVRALDLALQTLTQLKKDYVGADMLASAHAYVLGQYPLDFETAADWAAAMGEVELFGVGTDYIDDYARQLHEVSVRDAQRVIDEVFPEPDSCALVVIGDAIRLRDELQQYGPVTQMHLLEPEFAATGRPACI